MGANNELTSMMHSSSQSSSLSTMQTPAHAPSSFSAAPEPHRRQKYSIRQCKVRRLDLDAQGPHERPPKCTSPTETHSITPFLVSLDPPATNLAPHLPSQTEPAHQPGLWETVTPEKVEFSFDMAFELADSTDEEESLSQEGDHERARARQRRDAIAACHATSSPIWIPYWERQPFDRAAKTSGMSDGGLW